MTRHLQSSSGDPAIVLYQTHQGSVEGFCGRLTKQMVCAFTPTHDYPGNREMLHNVDHRGNWRMMDGNLGIKHEFP
jgi:hypothetical protein